MKKVKAGGGWPAIWYSLKKAREAGGLLRFYRAMRSRNACKTCALGMGGQRGGMVNESGRFPEVCKKSMQAMAADMQGAIRPHFFDDFDFQKLRGFTSRQLEAAGRITEPLYAGPLDQRFRTIDWDEALQRTTDKLGQTSPDEAFFYFSGRSSNEAGFLLQLIARLYGTNHVNNCSYYCHQASGVGLSSVTGSGTATVVLDDLDGCDLLILIGANPSSNHPRLMRTLVELRRRGGRVVVINPLREVGLERFKVPSDMRSLLMGSTIADHYLQPHIGGDIALMSGLLKAVLERDGVDRAFVDDHVEGWDDVEAHVRGLAWDQIVEHAGVARTQIDQVADLYIRSRATIFAWAMGITHHEHGVQNVQMIANLALARGMVGRPNCGLLPLRGHSNVQGVGSMGVTPALKPALRAGVERQLGITLPTSPGLDTLGCITRAHEGQMRWALCLGGNLYGSNPDSSFASQAMSRIDQVTYLSTTLNTGHVHGRGKETLILPVLARDEESEPTTQESMFNFVRLSDGGKARHQGPRSEVDVIASIGERVIGPDGAMDFSSMRRHDQIRRLIGAVVPGYAKIATMDATGQEFQIDGRTFHEPKFATENGRACSHVVPLPTRLGGNGRLRLMTVRSEGQFNTVVYEEKDLYRGQDRRDVIMVNQKDITSMGLAVDDVVTVRSKTGQWENVRVRTADIPPGNAVMYYPEANVLVPKVADAKSRTPAFKNIEIEVIKQTSDE
jgi:molybdopterin-dependent oxidoreductase alpha subunit